MQHLLVCSVGVTRLFYQPANFCGAMMLGPLNMACQLGRRELYMTAAVGAKLYDTYMLPDEAAELTFVGHKLLEKTRILMTDGSFCVACAGGQ